MCQIYTSILQKWKSVHCGDYFNDNDHRMGVWQPLKPQEGEMLNYSLWVPRSNLSNNGYLANVASQSLKQTPLLGHLSSSCWVFISPFQRRRPQWWLPGQHSVTPWARGSVHRLLCVGILSIALLFQGIWTTSFIKQEPTWVSYLFRPFCCQNCFVELVLCVYSSKMLWL